MEIKPLSRHSEIVVQELKNEILVYDLKTNKAICLNQISAMIWQLCDGQNSISEISRLSSEQMKTPVTEDLVWLTLEGLKRQALLDKNAEFEIESGGLSRRLMIKKVGLATTAALPFITSLTAPKAAAAQSGCPTCESLSANCGDPPDGCGGTLNCGTCTPPQTCGGGGGTGVTRGW